jgi:integrase
MKSDTRNSEIGPFRARKDFPSRAELRILMETFKGRWRPFLITAIFTSMRASELRGLIWPNVELERGAIHVRERADAWGTIGKQPGHSARPDGGQHAQGTAAALPCR